MVMVGVDSGSLYRQTHSLSRLAWSWVGGCLVPFYIHQMNRVNSRNGSAMMDDSTIIIIIIIIIIKAVLDDLMTHNLTLTEAVNLAQHQHLCWLLATTGTTHC